MSARSATPPGMHASGLDTDQLPAIRTPIPGPRSLEWARRLREVECREVTCLAAEPIFWERAAGSNVVDADGNRFVDLLAGFGAAVLGYAHPALVAVTQQQAARLGHTMGDVYPATLKVELLERLTAQLPGELGHGILSSSGSDAIESALKTALLVTGRPDVVAFEGAYHGLGFGALDLTHRWQFRDPFRDRLAERTHFVPYGDAAATRRTVQQTRAGAIIVEPIQGRGGLRIPPDGFLEALREIADAEGALLIVDEIFTGLGRTGRWLACERAGITPDLLALGKALGGGFPISVCLGRREIMDAWPASQGEALHTSTHLGNPLGCAIALGVLEQLTHRELPARALELGEQVLERLRSALASDPHVREVRGRGLMIAIELHDGARARAVVQEALGCGWILLAEGPASDVLALTPPLTISAPVLEAGVDRLVQLIRT